jgi:hypothetical protein
LPTSRIWASTAAFKNLIVRDFQPSRPQFGYIQVLEPFVVLASGAGLSRLKRLPARLEFVPGLGPHLTEVADAEGQYPELIKHSAHDLRAGQVHDWRQTWSPTVFFSLVTGQEEWQSHLHRIVKPSRRRRRELKAPPEPCQWPHTSCMPSRQAGLGSTRSQVSTWRLPII